MKYHLYIAIVSAFLISCNQHTKNNIKSVSNITDTTGFLLNCKILSEHASVGYLQGTDAIKDSTGLFGFFDCYKPNSYEIIFILHGGIKKRSIDSIRSFDKNFDSGCNNYFQDFDCFAFVYPMRDPEKQDDMHALNMSFPLTVKSYRRIYGDRWKFLNILKVNTFRELSKFEFNTIYNIN